MREANGSEAGSEPLIKGLAFNSVIEAVRSLREEGGVEELFGALPKGLALRLKQQEVLVSGWYPVATYCELMAGVRRMGGEAFLREVGAVSMKSDLTSIHRLLLRMLSPTTLMSISQRMFPRYFTMGKIETAEKGDRYLRARYSGCKGWSRDMWVEQFAGAECFLQLAGAKAVTFRSLLGGRDGDTEAVVEARWG